MKKIKLICFPYAGGVSQFYVNIFFNNLSPNLELIPIEYSGHGSRYTEELFTSIDEFINDVILEIKKNVHNSDDYILLGYSMGSKIIYRLYYELERMNFKLPYAMIFCATSPPNVITDIIDISDKSIVSIIESNPFANDIFSNTELLELSINILKADIQVLNSLNLNFKKCTISCPIFVFNGNLYVEIQNQFFEWFSLTTYKIHFIILEGGHFFLYQHANYVSELINWFILQNVL